jgi:hypothetical protein
MRGTFRRVVILSCLVVLAGCGYSQVVPAKRGTSLNALQGTTSTTDGSTTSTTGSTTSTTGSSSSNPLLECGSTFFSSVDQAAITQSFGPNHFCYFSVGTDTWFVLVSPALGEFSSGGISPGGAVALVDACQAADSTCLDADAEHSLSDFTAYPAPDPTVADMRVLQLVVGANEASAPDPNGALVLVNDNRCGFLIFDLVTYQWYVGDSSDGTALAEGDPDAATVVPAAPSFPASESPPPAPTATPPSSCTSV